MKAVILSGGIGERLFPFTLNRKKFEIPILDRPFLYYTLDELKGLVDEVVLAIRGNKEKAEKVLKEYGEIKFKVVEIKETKGNVDSLKYVEKYVNEDFLLIYEDVYTTGNYLKELMKYENAILAYPVENPKDYGVLVIENNKLVDLEEKPEKPKSNLINAGIYKLTPDIFSYLDKVEISPRGEREITDAILMLAKEKGMYVVKTDVWLELGKVWNIIDINKYFLEKEIKKLEDKDYRAEKGLKEVKEGVFVLENVDLNDVKIKNKAIIYGEIKPYSVIEGIFYLGKNSEFGPHSYLRVFGAIMENSKVGFSCEMKNSVIFKNTKISHLSYIGDSVVGENVNLGAMTVLANLRFDKKTVKVKLKNKLIDSKRKKLGAFIGDNVNSGVQVAYMPGTLVGNNSIIYPKKLVKGRVEPNTILS